MQPRTATQGRSGGIDADSRGGASGSGLPDQTHQLVARGHLMAADARPFGTMGCRVGDHASTSVPNASVDP